ncbi:MAG TPA: PHB depolymerase family esterase [Nakamurella sp.]|nr:PHB depolymerase family esterase [Nakamurella sp.]
MARTTRARTSGSALLKALLPRPTPARRTRRPAAPKIGVRRAPSAARRRPAPKPTPTDGRGTWRQYRYSGAAGSRAYRVYVPAGLRRTSRVPLLLALHGCGQNAVEFAASTRFNRLADKHQFVVVYPEQTRTHNPQRCWNWFRPGHQFRAKGEPGIMAGIVRRVVAETTHWRIDPRRVYVAGLSAGGAMAVVLAAVYPELFAAVGVHSAPPYRAATGTRNALSAMRGRTEPPPPDPQATTPMPPMIVFQGSMDGIVHADNAEHIADQWLARHGIGARLRGRIDPPRRPRVTTSGPARPSTPHSRRGYHVSRWATATERKALEVWLVDGLRHAWSGGSPGGSFSDPRGPRASTEMWRFFTAHRAAAAASIRAS